MKNVTWKIKNLEQKTSPVKNKKARPVFTDMLV